MRIPNLALAALLVATLSCALAPTAAASHWCGQTTFDFTPSAPVAGRAITFVVTIHNTGVDNTQLNAVEMKFSWEGTWRNAGAGTVLAGQSGSYSVQATPPSAGSYSVEIKATGTSSGDWLHEVTDCSSTASITATAAPAPGFEGALGVVAIAAAGIVLALRRQV
jgi:hypothetical protein